MPLAGFELTIPVFGGKQYVPKTGGTFIHFVNIFVLDEFIS
jgi:hypothetical protein